MKKQLLDPLGTVCKLISLYFTDIDTKIKIKSHILKLDNPAHLQFLYRWYNGDGRENISELYYVIIRVIKWYLVEENVENTINNSIEISRSESIKKMMTYLCLALKKLQRTYQFGNVILALQYFINIITESMEGRFVSEMLPESMIDNSEYENLLDYNKLKNFWEVKTLDTICELYDNCFRVLNDKQMSIDAKDALIQGYLRSVNSSLEITDSEFQTMINNSKKG